MKLMKKTGTYKASNVEFNPTQISATSYGWWHFVRVINRKVVFNRYNYSPSTCKHQQKVLRLMRELGIEIDLFVSTRESLSTETFALESAIKNEYAEVDALKAILSNNRRKKALDAERFQTLANHLSKIEDIKETLHGSKLLVEMN